MRRCYLFIFLFSIKIIFSQVFNEPVFRYLEPEQLGIKKAWLQQWDHKGVMWAASNEGLICYNGYSTKKHSHVDGDSSGILSNKIQTMMIDSKDNIWIAYIDLNGVSKLNIATGKIKHFLPVNNSKISVPDFMTSAFKEDNKGNIWVLTWGSGICKIDPETGVCKTYLFHTLEQDEKLRKGIRGNLNRIKAMLEMPDGRFLVTFFAHEETEYLPLYFDPIKETFEAFPVNDYLQNCSPMLKNRILMSLKLVHFIYSDKQNNLWFGTYCGLVNIDLKNKNAYRVSGLADKENTLNLDNARNFVVDENDNLWVGTPNAGIMFVNTQNRNVTYVKHDPKINSSIADNRIRTMKKDPEGNIWISTEPGGFSIYNSLLQQFNVASWNDMELDYTNRSEQRVPVNQMLVLKNGLVYISSETGLSIFDPKTNSIIKRIDPKIKLNLQNKFENWRSRIQNFKFIDEQHILIISPVRPAIYDIKNDSYKKIAINDTVAEKMWMDILFRHSLKKDPLVVFGNLSELMFDVDITNSNLKKIDHVMHNKKIKGNYSYILNSGKWLLSYGEKEFAVFDPASKQYDFYNAHNKEHFFPDSTIQTAYMDKQGKIWFGTSNGLYQFDETTGKSECLNPKLGLGKEVVNAIISNENDIWWLALEKHLLRWDAKTNTTFRIGKELGLNVGSFLGSIAQCDSSGKIYIATINGLLIFDPSKIKVPSERPQIYLSSLIIKDDTLSTKQLNDFTEGKTILNWNENFLNIEFSTNQIYAPIPNHFFYRLLGLDSFWQDNQTSNRLRYTSLTNGSYTLEIKTTNGYNLSSNVLKIPFKITAPFWLTWWFYLLVCTALIFVVYSFIKYREKAFIKQQAVLEQRIQERTAEVVAKAEEIKLQKDVILEKNKELTDSIYYAQRIQHSILPSHEQLISGLPKHGIFFRPKDIVSGDFYWYSKQKDSVLWAVVDCTGHGVPGGFMSMLGSGLLNQIVNEELKLNPGEILNNLRDRVIIALKQTGAYGENKDGMDITLCRWIQKENKLQVSSANNPLYIVRNSELIEIKADKQPIGIYVGEQKSFITHDFDLQKGDKIYMTSDGYADQFGGPKGKKFKTSNFEKLLIKINSQPLDQQIQTLQVTFDDWKDNYDQLDDVCVMGVEF